MTALLRSELARARGRRLVWIVAALAVLGLVLLGVLTYVRTSADASILDGTRVANTLKGTSGILALVGWVIGASLIGAEHQSRGLTTTLTFVPSRTRVFLAKLAAAVVVSVTLAVATLGLAVVAIVPTLLAHGGTHPGDASVLEIAGVAMRGTLLVGVATAIGFALASIGRNTAAALGAGFAYLIVVEQLVGELFAGWRRWLLLGNALVFVDGKSGFDIAGRGPVGAGIFFGVVGLTLAAGAATAFHVRDVA